MKRFSKIIILVIVVIIVLILLISMISRLGDTEEINENTSFENEIIEEGVDKEVVNGIIDDINDFFNIEQRLEDFYNRIKQEQLDVAYELLSDECKTTNNITEENLKNSLNIIDEGDYITKTIYEYEIYKDDYESSLFFVQGLVYSSTETQEVYDIVIVDYFSASYSIVPGTIIDLNESYFNELIEEIEKNEQNVEIIENFITEGYYSVERNDYNYSNVNNFDNIQIIEKLLNRYIIFSLYDSEYIYNYISEDTKTVYFDTLEKYDEYIQERKENLENTYVSSYKIETLDSETNRYILKDRYENYYIFDIKNINEFTIYIQ